MTNTALLNEAIKESGKKKIYLAERIGVSKQQFNNLCNNRAQFKAEQIQILCEELGINLTRMKVIFFARRGA